MYPPIEPFERGFLDTGERHRLYRELSGNPAGIPAVFLHGGPGAGSPPAARQLFDPERYRLLVFDQRGAGRSEPHADLENNSTWHLVEDLERLRKSMGVDRWVLFGGSWGSTLALAYAVTHPDRVMALILRGIFTARRSEKDWIYREGASWIFPEAWEAFLDLLDEEERSDPLRAYYRRLTSDDPETRVTAAISWSRWEAAIVQLAPTAELQDDYADPHFAAALARIEAHYMVNDCWLDEGQLLRGAGRLADVPGWIIQGRYDACTPPRTAWDLHQRWPGSKLTFTTAGHRFDEPETLSALIEATDEFARRSSF